MRLTAMLVVSTGLIVLLALAAPRMDPLSAVITALILAALSSTVGLGTGRRIVERVARGARAGRSDLHPAQGRGLRAVDREVPLPNRSAARSSIAARQIHRRLDREPQGCHWHVYWRASSGRLQGPGRPSMSRMATVVARWCERRCTGRGRAIEIVLVPRQLSWVVRVDTGCVRLLAQGGDWGQARRLARTRFGYRESRQQDVPWQGGALEAAPVSAAA